MGRFKAACIQLRSGKDLAANAERARGLIAAAVAEGATFVQTPEMSNLLVRGREELFALIGTAANDPFLEMARGTAREFNVHIQIGSIATPLENGRVANRGYLIGSDGEVITTYDKIHMFDVDLANGESWRESSTYTPGDLSPVIELSFATLGMAICYDIRFPAIFRSQAKNGANVLTAPAAFTRQTGEAHWHVLQRARAIENGAYVISSAQGGRHEDGRETYGHSLIVDPWGKVIAELPHTDPGYVVAEIDTALAAAARSKIPAIANERNFTCAPIDSVKEKTA